MSGKARVDVRSATTSSPRIHAAGEPVRSVREADLVSNDRRADPGGSTTDAHRGSFALDPTPSTRSRGTLERMRTADIDKPTSPLGPCSHQGYTEPFSPDLFGEPAHASRTGSLSPYRMSRKISPECKVLCSGMNSLFWLSLQAGSAPDGVCPGIAGDPPVESPYSLRSGSTMMDAERGAKRVRSQTKPYHGRGRGR